MLRVRNARYNMETVGHNGETVKRESVEEPQPVVSGAVPFGPVPASAETGPDGNPPSLSVCHNCIPPLSKPAIKLSGSCKKMGRVIELEVQRLAKTYSVERLGFLTLTFRDDVGSIHEAQRRFHSLLTNCLSQHFKGGITVWERFGHGIHFHMIVVVDEDIRTGFDFEAVKRKDYRSACLYLREMWATLRVVLPEYDFGRHELLAVRTTAEAVGRYVGKYISKHYEQRREEDRGARIVRFWGVAKQNRCASAQFAWVDGRAAIWRLGVKAFVGYNQNFSCGGMGWEGLRILGGPRWAFHLGREIWRLGVEVWKGGEANGCQAQMETLNGSHVRAGDMPAVRGDRASVQGARVVDIGS